MICDIKVFEEKIVMQLFYILYSNIFLIFIQILREKFKQYKNLSCFFSLLAAVVTCTRLGLSAFHHEVWWSRLVEGL